LVEGLVESQQKIVLIIARIPQVSIKKMSELVGISTTAIDKNISVLKDKNMIRRVGSDKGGYWEIIDNQ
jgi:ATP-dependent DNA helicase RecG